MWKTPLLLKFLCLATLVIVLALAGYWAKCQLGINIIPGYSWEKHLPYLNSFQKIERVIRLAPGKVYTLAFDGLLPRYYWDKIWARDAGTVHDDIVPDGLHGSKALRIRSTSPRDWAFQSSIRYEVSPGDMFELSGYSRTTGDAATRMRVIFYDALDNVTKLTGVSIEIKDANWQKYASRFVVPEGTTHVRVRLAGNGIGECSFDDIALLRVR